MEARIYDFDSAWDVADGLDNKGEYVTRDVDYMSSDNTLVLKNGTRSHTYNVISSDEPICNFCNPIVNAFCNGALKGHCPSTKLY